MKLLADYGTEWVRRVTCLLLEGIQFIPGGVLVRVEPEIISLRDVIRVHRHTLEVVRAVNTDSNLSIVGRTEGEVFDSTSNLNDTVHISTTLISIANLQSLTGNCSGLLDTVYRMTPVLNIDPGGLNFAPLGQNRLVVHARRHQDLHFGELTSRLLLDLHLVDVIALSLEHGGGSLHLGACDTHIDLNAETDVEKTVLTDLLLEFLG